MKKLLVIITVIAILSGCKSTSQIEGGETSKLTYNPVGKEIFVFSEKIKTLQKYGYSKFCSVNIKDKDSCPHDKKLSYTKYLGKKAYLTSKIKGSKVLIENGDIAYFYGDYNFKFNDIDGYIRLSNIHADYNPKGKETFVVVKPYNKDYPVSVCREPTHASCSTKLSNKSESIIGKHGYFDERPILKDEYNSNIYFYPVTLEDGERFYYESEIDKKLTGENGFLSSSIALSVHIKNLKKYKSSQEYKPVKFHEKSTQEYKPVKFHEKSKLMIVKYEETSFGKKYFLSNGSTVYSDKLKLIREIAKLPSYSPEVDKFITEFSISKDSFEGNYFIKAISTTEPFTKINSPEAYVNSYIGINEKGIWLRMKIKYYSNEWLFIKQFKTLSDNRKWEFSDIDFKRDNDKYGIKEWADISLGQDKNMYNVFKDGFNSDKFIIRFIGNYYRNDIEIQHKLKNSNLIKSYEILKGN